MKRILTLVIFISFIFPLAGQNSWEKKTSFVGSKRARSVTFSIASRGYLCCGEDTNDVELNDLWEYDPGTDSWTQKANLPGVGRRDAIGFSIGTKGYVGTGMDAPESWTGNILNDFYEYSPATNTWTTRAAYPGGFGGIYFATAFVVNGRGYVCGGKQGPSSYTSQLWEYNPANNTWTQKASFPGGVRYGMSSFSLNGKGYVGLGTDENWFMADFWEYTPAGNTWLQKASFPGSARSFASSFALGSRGYVGLGSDGGYKDDFFEYEPISNSWSVKANYGGGARRSAPSFVITGAGYILTGKGFTGKHRDMWQYHPYIVGLDEITETQVRVFPNPAVEVIKFDISPDLAMTDGLVLQLISADGKIIKSETVNGRTHIELYNENWAQGAYIYSFTDGTNRYANGRLLIQ
jgi:N-acetylneuraminic acid mutarotase